MPPNASGIAAWHRRSDTSGPLPVLAEDEGQTQQRQRQQHGRCLRLSDRSSVRRPAECAELVTMVAVATRKGPADTAATSEAV